MTLADKAANGPYLQGACIFPSDAYASVVRMESLSVPSEKTPLRIFPHHFLAVTCNVGFFGIRFSNKNGTIFRNGTPVPTSALLVANFALAGGAGVQCGENGGDAFFARDGLERDGDALLTWRMRRGWGGNNNIGARRPPWSPFAERGKIGHL